MISIEGLSFPHVTYSTFKFNSTHRQQSFFFTVTHGLFVENFYDVIPMGRCMLNKVHLMRVGLGTPSWKSIWRLRHSLWNENKELHTTLILQGFFNPYIVNVLPQSIRFFSNGTFYYNIVGGEDIQYCDKKIVFEICRIWHIWNIIIVL